MKNNKKTKLAIAAVLSAAVAFGGVGVSSDIAYAVNATLVKTSAQNGADWNLGKDSNVTAKGVGIPKNGQMALARTAAILDAQRNLLGIIKGLTIDSETLMKDLMVESDTVTRKIGGVLKGAVIVREGENSDGTYFVEMSVPLFGDKDSVASAVIPTMTQNLIREPIIKIKPEESKIPPKEVRIIQNASYTGLVIDASGLGLEPTFSPVIFDTNGRAIYGVKNIDADFAIREGMVGYARSVESATSMSRVGSNPLVIKAVNVKGGASVSLVNAVISVEDADRVLFANETDKMLDKCAVVLVR